MFSSSLSLRPLLTLWVLPVLLSSLTSFTYKEALNAIKHVCLFPLQRVLTTLALPFIIQYMKKLKEKEHGKDPHFEATSQTIFSHLLQFWPDRQLPGPFFHPLYVVLFPPSFQRLGKGADFPIHAPNVSRLIDEFDQRGHIFWSSSSIFRQKRLPFLSRRRP